MRITTALTAAVLAAVATLPLAGVALATADRDCRDFTSQAAAQAALDSTSDDAGRLDADGDGAACEDYFGMGAVAPLPPPVPVDRPVADQDPGAVDVPVGTEHQVPVKPRGAPDTGDGSVAPLDAAPLDAAPPGVLAAGLGAVAALAAAYLVARRTPVRSPKAGPGDRRRGRRRSAGGVTGRAR